jgi:hypothetical protein
MFYRGNGRRGEGALEGGLCQGGRCGAGYFVLRDPSRKELGQKENATSGQQDNFKIHQKSLSINNKTLDDENILTTNRANKIFTIYDKVKDDLNLEEKIKHENKLQNQVPSSNSESQIDIKIYEDNYNFNFI